jgi:predicted acylesterase/phospholipase RssA
MPEAGRLGPGEPRSAGAIPQRRVPQAWPKDRRFRILSVDGGGIRGIFPAAVLAGLERCYTGGNSIASYFDLATGTSTGGILALGLGGGYSAWDLFELYALRGGEIFPPRGRVGTWLRGKRQYARYSYDRRALERLLTDKLGSRLFGESRLRLCIPAFEGRHSEVFVFKTPHHLDYKTDRFELMTTVGLATSAAPTYFRPLEHGGYTLVDGGVWANNPIMLAVVEALICFDIGRDQIDVLSIGCGDERYVVSNAEINKGGLWHWRKILGAAMRLQSLAAVNQARLLLGPQQVVRIDPPPSYPPIGTDDWRTSVEKLVPTADQALLAHGDRLAEMFLRTAADPFVPIGVGQ